MKLRDWNYAGPLRTWPAGSWNKSMNMTTKGDLLAFQNTYWALKTGRDKHQPGFVTLSVTTNGYQWASISILINKVPEVIAALKKAGK